MQRALQRRIFLSLFFLARGVIAQTPELQSFEFGPDPARPNLSVQIVGPKDLSAVSLRQNVQNAFQFVENIFQVSFRDSFEIYFDAGPDFHNGLTTVIPRNRIYVHLEPPEIEDSIGLYRDFVFETLVHELAHLIIMQSRGGIFSALDAVVGNSSRPLGLWPRWMHEGLAVWTEAKLGGRKNSGWVEFDLKKTRAFYKATEKFPIDTTVLDGQKELQTVDAGDLPYHFGTALFHRVAKKLGPEGLKNFILSSGKNLGLSYRILLRDEFGVDLNKEFLEFTDQLKTSPPIAEALDDTKYANLTSAKKIVGPFRAENQNKPVLSWIEFGSSSENSPTLNIWSQGESIQKFPWKINFSQPKAVYGLNSKQALVLFRQNPDLNKGNSVDPKNFTRSFVGVYDLQTHKISCVFDALQSPREISIHGNHIAWIGKSPAFKPQINHANFNTENCTVTSNQLIKEGDSFERFSGILLTSDSILFSKSRYTAQPGMYLEYPEILRLDSAENKLGPSTRFSNQTPWTFIEPLDPQQNSFLLTQFSPSNFGPALLYKNLNKNPESFTLKALNLRTGSTRSTASLNPGKILVKIGFLNEEVLKEIPVEDFTNKSELVFDSLKIPHTLKSPHALEVSASEHKEIYSRFSTFWPQFWVPQLQATTGGFIFLGESFYEDITRTLSGSTGIGYETFSKRPYFRTNLGLNNLNWGPFHSIGTGLFYSSATAIDPNQGEILIQDRFGGSAALSSTYVFADKGLRVETQLGMGLIKASNETALSGFLYLFPIVSVSVASKKGLRNRASFYDSVGAGAGWVLDQTLKFFKGHDSYTSLQGQIGLVWDWSLHGQAEYGSTDIRNYPATFFEVGGLQALNLFSPTFLTRGFDYRILSVREVARYATEISFPLVRKTLFSSDWNRFSLDKIQGRFVLETLTFSSFRTARMGDRYLTSVGGILDFWGSGMHYLDYKMGFGLFKGFGPFGETKFFVVLSSGLNI